MFTLKDEIPDHTLIMIIIVVPIIITLFTAGLLLIYIYIFFPDYCRASCICCCHDVTSIKVASKRKWNGIIMIIITMSLSSFKCFEKRN